MMSYIEFRHSPIPISWNPPAALHQWLISGKLAIMVKRLLKPPKHSSFLLGPRATGKSTWIKEHFRTSQKYDLLNTSEFIRLSRDPEILYKECSKTPRGDWIVIDEIQRIPELLNEVHRL